jgi:transposase
MREDSPLGSQMVCNAIFSVCKAYKAKTMHRDEPVPVIQFRKYKSVHFDQRTYSIKGNILSLYTLEGLIRIPMRMGPFQEKYFSQGIPREAELVCRKGRWYFNLVLEIPDPIKTEKTSMIGIDLGENVLAATSSGKLYGGGKIRYERDQYKAEAKGLQVIYVNPAYSSQACSKCGCLGVRYRHHFKCLCGHQQHSDLNASRNLCRFAQSIGRATCDVNRTQVAAPLLG